jgi:hypothetical protein
LGNAPTRSHLHAKAYAQVGHLVLTSILCCQDLALNTTVAKATRHQHTISDTELSQQHTAQHHVQVSRGSDHAVCSRFVL